MDNDQIAKIFFRIADVLEIEGDNRFRVRAYRTAAQNISGLSRQLSAIIKEDASYIQQIPGIGRDLAEKVKELLESGSLNMYNDLMGSIPPGILDVLDLEGLGPKRVKRLKDEFQIKGIDDLEKICKEGVLRELKGFGKKTEQKILDSIEHFRKREGRMLLPDAQSWAERVIDYLKADPNFKEAEFAGSLRRGKETIGDLDILAFARDEEKAMERFVSFSEAERVLEKGRTKSSIKLMEGPQVDLRLVESSALGSAKIYFTGSLSHNVAIRKVAKRKGYKVSEYGVFTKTDDDLSKNIASRSEQEVYAALGMQWVPPELREDRGEVEAALRGEIPKELVSMELVKGELHTHSTITDGRDSIEDMVASAKKMGYDYFAVTEHTSNVRVAGGLDEKGIASYIMKIRELNRSVKGIEILAGAEVDIHKNGELDLDDELISELDIVICAVHSYFDLSSQKQTDRLLRALENPYVNILAHPTCRLILKRRPIDVDIEKVFKKCAENRVFLEVNSHGNRMDLKDIHCRRAQELGAKIVVSSDAHATGQLNLMKYGVTTARRGWVLKENVLNTYTLEELEKALSKDIY